MGVISRRGVPQGKTFGPIPSSLALVDPAVLIGHRTCDTLPDIHTVKLDLNESSGPAQLGEWVPYVQAGRNDREQNVEAFLRDGQLYYRVIKNIRDNEELFIWYSAEYATILGVPPLQPYHRKGDLYWCPNCTESFRYPNCLRAHMRFKCKNRHRVSLYINNPPPTGHGYYHHHHHHHIGHALSNQMAGSGRNNNGTPSPKQSPTSSTGSRSPTHASSPRLDDLHNDNFLAERKRKCESDDEDEHGGGSSPKRAQSSSPISVGSNTPPPAPSPVDSSRDSPPSSGGKYHREMETAHQRVYGREDTGSAFHRVERRPVMLERGLPRTSLPVTMPSVYPAGLTSAPHAVLSPAMLNMNALDKSKMPHNILNAIYRPPMAAGFGKIIPGGIPVGLAAHYPPNENDPMRAQRNALMMDLQNIENDNAGKMAFMREAAMPMVPPMYRNPNPMKLMASAPPPPPAPMQASMSSLALAQNWCAKCNASFRMTSDLVYHMRSHHKREFDPVKKKRDEKLKCDVCGETFKERHHLTRHMTSHS